MDFSRRVLRFRTLLAIPLLLWTQLWEAIGFLSNVQYVSEHLPILKSIMTGYIGTWAPPLIGTAIIIWAVRDKRDSIQVYENQRALPGIREEIKRVKAADIVWPVGGSANVIDDDDLPNIRRLILGDPRDTPERRVERHGAQRVESVKASTEDLTFRAQKKNVAVKWLSHPEFSLIVSNRTKWWHRKWARLEVVIPYAKSSTERPSILVTNRHAGLLTALENAYEEMWKNAYDAPLIATPTPSVVHMTSDQPSQVL